MQTWAYLRHWCLVQTDWQGQRGRRVVVLGVLWGLWWGLYSPSIAADDAPARLKSLVKRDLSVEIRQIEEGAAEGQQYGAGPSDSRAGRWQAQMLLVRNGEKATLRINDAIPMQWVQSAQSSAKANNGINGSNNNANNSTTTTNNNAVAQEVVWFDAGQSMSIWPQWAGGAQAIVQVEIGQASVGQRNGAELPTQSRSTVRTTLSAPLAQWVTLAASGDPPYSDVYGSVSANRVRYSSESGQRVRRLLQIRVMAL